MSILSKLQALLSAANTKTGQSDTTLTAAMQSLVDGYGQGGSGLTTVASGTFTGSGSYFETFTIGTKMAQTDFMIKIKAHSDSVFEKNTDYKYAVASALVLSECGYYDLSTDGNNKYLTSSLSYNENDSGTIASVSVGKSMGSCVEIRNTSLNMTNLTDVQISKTADDFKIKIGINNSIHKWVTDMVYDYEVVYFGSNPETDIIEIS